MIIYPKYDTKVAKSYSHPENINIQTENVAQTILKAPIIYTLILNHNQDSRVKVEKVYVLNFIPVGFINRK